MIEDLHRIYPMAAFNASPAPWKKSQESIKSAMKMQTKEMTTAEVVDSPTPLAPPSVVTPHVQLTIEMMPPNTTDLILVLIRSHGCRALAADSKIMLELTLYTESASSTLAAMATEKHMTVKMGKEIQDAITLGVTR
jgi:hypothetical protein